MTTARLRHATPAGTDAAGSTESTRILDHDSGSGQSLWGGVEAASDLDFLRAAYTLIRDEIRPVYALDETQPVSRTLTKRRGSCSQRLAVLESAARSRGIRTRVRILIVDGSFWYPRFPRLTAFIPDVILLAWPQFFADGEWLDAADLFAVEATAAPFANAGSETLFDAIGRGVTHWDATPRCDCGDPALADKVHADLGWAEHRDEVFARYGQNLPHVVRATLEPMFSRWAAGARAA